MRLDQGQRRSFFTAARQRDSLAAAGAGSRSILDEFKAATGVPVRLVRPPLDPFAFGQHDHELCRLINAGGPACEACRGTHHWLRARATSSSEPVVASCAAGLLGFAKALRLPDGGCMILEGGRVRCGRLERAQLEFVATRLGTDQQHPELVPYAHRLQRATPVISRVKLTAVLALLGCVGDRLVRAAGHGAAAEPVLVATARSYIRDRFLGRLEITKIARQAHVGERHLMRVFKRHTGQTVVQFINHLRIEEAKRRLANDSSPITQLALESGFESVPYFNRVFRRVVGMSPREFRKQGC